MATEQQKLTMQRALQRQKDKVARANGIPVTIKGPKSVYSSILADLICTQLSEGKSLKLICSQEGYPTPPTVMAWVKSPDEIARPGFVDRYMKARELGYHLMADEIIEISDNSGKDKIKKWINGKEVELVDHENIQRDRLRVDTRKFILAKALPKIYGDSIKVEHSISVDLITRMEKARQRLSAESIEQEMHNIIEGTAESVD